MAERIPLFPLSGPLLPHTDLGLHVFEDRYRRLVADCLENDAAFGVALVRRPARTGCPEPHAVGTLARIAGYARLPDGRYLLEVEGTRRFQIEHVEQNGSYPSARIWWLPEEIGNFARARAASDDVESLVFLYRSLGGDGDLPLRLSVDPIVRSYQVASLLPLEPPARQSLLEVPSAAGRLEAEIAILKREIALIDDIRSGQR